MPLAFAYRSLDGTRIGVLGGAGVTSAALVIGAGSSAPVAFGRAGSPACCTGAPQQLDTIALTVDLLDASGHRPDDPDAALG